MVCRKPIIFPVLVVLIDVLEFYNEGVALKKEAQVSAKKVIAGGLTALAAAVTMAVAAAAPAAAAPDCYIIKGIGAGNGFIFAESEIYCESTGASTPRWIEIRRQDSSGAWITLAGGTGYVEYYCVGTATNTYHTNGTAEYRDRVRSVTANCG